MNEFLSDLLLLTLGATLAPIYPIGLLLLLQGERGLARAIAFVSGAVAWSPLLSRPNSQPSRCRQRACGYSGTTGESRLLYLYCLVRSSSIKVLPVWSL
ncbi:MAG: hypothetical protein HC802_07225 [Caldilineaceae bacterium]|nr:hypothetical protein [Caldilineaceae bacterium]